MSQPPADMETPMNTVRFFAALAVFLFSLSSAQGQTDPTIKDRAAIFDFCPAKLVGEKGVINLKACEVLADLESVFAKQKCKEVERLKIELGELEKGSQSFEMFVEWMELIHRDLWVVGGYARKCRPQPPPPYYPDPLRKQ